MSEWLPDRPSYIEGEQGAFHHEIKEGKNQEAAGQFVDTVTELQAALADRSNSETDFSHISQELGKSYLRYSESMRHKGPGDPELTTARTELDELSNQVIALIHSRPNQQEHQLYQILGYLNDARLNIEHLSMSEENNPDSQDEPESPPTSEEAA